jgi:hypothetical protein
LSNAKRLERVGAAILVEPTIDRGRKKITPDELRRAVATALFDPGYRRNARSRVACELGRSEACGRPHCGIGQAMKERTMLDLWSFGQFPPDQYAPRFEP